MSVDCKVYKLLVVIMTCWNKHERITDEQVTHDMCTTHPFIITGAGM